MSCSRSRSPKARALLYADVPGADGPGRQVVHLFDATTGQSTPLGEASTWDMLEAGSRVLARGLLVDLGTGPRPRALTAFPPARGASEG